MIIDKSILVTQPSLPPLEAFIELLEGIWENKIVTNNGPLHAQLEEALAEFLGVKFVSLFANGTLALMSALQALKISGEVITTPYTFVATVNALEWNGLSPVFVDINPKSGNLDPNKIEAAITEHTQAIMPVHVYGNPCDVGRIQEIADRYGLKVIYDAAQAFNVKIGGESILNHGDLSVLSFHATKVYNTIEGGAIISHDLKTKSSIDHLKNFGFVDETTVIAAGINGKMNELQAAVGLLQLKFVDENIEKRRRHDAQYRKSFNGVKGLSFLEIEPEIEYNFSYFPIFIEDDPSGEKRDQIYYALQANKIFSRRYFYPLVTKFPMYNNITSASDENLTEANRLAAKVLCLPMYPSLLSVDIDRIVSLVSLALEDN